MKPIFDERWPLLSTAGLLRTVMAAIRGVPYDLRQDAEQEAWIGVMDAAQRFTPSHGVSFRTFADRRARGAVKDFLRRQDPLTRRARKRVKAGTEEGIQHIAVQPWHAITHPPSTDTLDVQALLPVITDSFERAILTGYLNGEYIGEIARSHGRSHGCATQAMRSITARLRRHVKPILNL